MNEKITIQQQDKQKEISFFDRHADMDSYDVFMPESSKHLIQTCTRVAGLKPGARVADLGCGSGVFTNLLHGLGFKPVGLDISPKLIALGRQKYPDVEFLEGDVEHLPFPSSSLDGVLLSGLVHHFPDPSRCAAEVFRVLKTGGAFVAFDPNRMNPFMYLYRDRSSPFYSPVGVTENERPVLAHQIAAIFRNSGFKVSTDYISNLRYRYLASSKLRWLLPAYNAIDRMLFAPDFMKPMRSFVLTYGEKP
jgi:ubiquinone/menaquinone biosynthesis C-methylase UbiE